MTYEDAGFDKYLLRPLEATYTEQIGIDSSSAYEQISGLQVKGDTISSNNGNLKLDLQNDRFTVADGIVDRVEFGRLSDGSMGLIIRDSDGNEIMHISGNMNIIQSSNQHMQLNFNEENLIVQDEGGQVKALFGKGVF